MAPNPLPTTLPAAILAVALGAVAGPAAYAFVYARGYSYLSNDPAACANCHVMQGHLDDWARSPHHAAATCNDCHVPADPVGKYVVKAENGWHHSVAFTLGNFPDRIRAREASRQVVETRCRGCHAEVAEAMGADPSISCVRCHASVGHLR